MFTDMVGYSALAQRDEPLALRLLETQRALVRPIFQSHHGREVNRMGDGFLIEFPSALQALECAINVQRALLAHNERSRSERVELRIGVHLGDVIDQAGDLLGDAVNIAARIEPLAETSGICISGPVFDQVRNKVPYACTQLEHAFLKNIDSPIAVYSVDLPWHGPSAARITPWTDRETEVETLNAALQDVVAGRGHVIALAGEPGIGKTRLAEETIRRGSAKGFRTLRGRGIQDQLGLPYGPWAEAIRGFVRDAPDPMVYKLCTKCQATVVQLVPELADRVGAGPPPPALEPEQARLAFFEGVTQFVRNICQEAPLLFLLDDIQWADSASLRLIGYLARQVPSQRLLLILSYRDSDVAENEPLRAVLSELRKDHLLSDVPMRRMAAEPSQRLVSAILSGEALLPNLVGLVQERTGGNPLFAEELLRSMVEEQLLVRRPEGWTVQLTAEVGIPSSMRELILRRVGRVSEEARTVLSTASVLRGEFEFDLLLRLCGMQEEALIRSVEELLRARLLREREYEPGHPMYRFADDQTQAVLYREFSLARRQRLNLLTTD
jgi:class 3 adenylate cyclase